MSTKELIDNDYKDETREPFFGQIPAGKRYCPECFMKAKSKGWAL